MKVARLFLLFMSTVIISCVGMTQSASGQVWSGAEIIDAGAGNATWAPVIAVDSSGNAIAVFGQLAGGANYRMYANRYVAGTGWAGTMPIDTGAANDTRDSVVAFDASGNAIALFEQENGGAVYHIYANWYIDGSGWAGPVQIDAGGANEATNPQIAFDTNGNAIAVFEQQLAGVWRIYANRHAVGGGWTIPATTIIDAATGNNASDPQIAFDTNGNAIAVFRQMLVGDSRIYANRYVAGTGWTIPATTIIDAGAGNEAITPQIAFDGQDNAIAVFTQKLAGVQRIYANRYVAGTGWTIPATTIIDAATGNNANNPQIAFDSDDNAIVVFRQILGADYRIYANRYVSGTGWEGVGSPIDAGDGNSAGQLQIACDANGNFITTFRQSDGADDRIYANRYAPGSGWTGAATIDAGAGNNALNPQIAFGGDGNAIVVFRQILAGEARTYANRYIAPTPTPTPTPIIDLTPNKYTFSSSDQIVCTADVQQIATPFYPFVRVITPSNQTLYYASGRGFVSSPTPYLGGGPFTLNRTIDDYPVFDVSFSGVAIGTYYLEGGAVDATQTTSVSNLVYVDGVDRETLTVQ